MSANRWTKNEIWAWYCSQKVDKYKLGRKKSDRADDEKNIRLRAVVNGDRLVIGLWKGSAGERCGVYYMTASGSTNVCTDGENWHSGKLEYIPLGGYWYWGSTYGMKYKVVSGEKEALAWLEEHFSSPYCYYNYNHCKHDVVDWIDDIERDITEHRRETVRKNHQKRIDDWLEDLPNLPEDIGDFVDNVVFGGLHYAFGRRGEKGFACSACARSFDIEKSGPSGTPVPTKKKRVEWKHGKYYECPLCHAKVKCHKTADGIEVNDRVMIVQSYHDKKGEICSIKREMYVRKTFAREGEHKQIWDGSLIVLPLDGSLADGSDCYYRNNGCWSDKNWTMFSHTRCYCYPELSALDGTAYDRLAMEAAAKKGWKLHYNNMMRYCHDEPRMEYLVKGNFYGLVDDMTAHLRTAGLMQGESAKDVLGLDGQGVARLRERQGGVTYLKWLRSAFMCGFKIPEKAMEYFCKKDITPTDVAEPLKYASPEQIANYIEKQRKLIQERKKYTCSASYVCTTWRDTLQFSGKFKLAGSKSNIFPKDLEARHDELVDLQNLEREREKAQEREERFPKVTPICDEIRAVYEWENAEYAVLVPHCVDDIVKEGCLLRHCVGTPDREGRYRYLERIEDNESYIMFLRKKSDVDAPWYTMEVEPGGAVRQLRTTGDDEGKDRSEAKAALALWRREVAKRIGRAELEAAEVSREKRLREFEELRRNGNIIRNGKLAGKLLVEVLEADFAEYNSDIA